MIPLWAVFVIGYGLFIFGILLAAMLSSHQYDRGYSDGRSRVPSPPRTTDPMPLPRITVFTTERDAD